MVGGGWGGGGNHLGSALDHVFVEHRGMGLKFLSQVLLSCFVFDSYFSRANSFVLQQFAEFDHFWVRGWGGERIV
jgi:hypothetical protein